MASAQSQNSLQKAGQAISLQTPAGRAAWGWVISCSNDTSRENEIVAQLRSRTVATFEQELNEATYVYGGLGAQYTSWSGEQDLPDGRMEKLQYVAESLFRKTAKWVADSARVSPTSVIDDTLTEQQQRKQLQHLKSFVNGLLPQMAKLKIAGEQVYRQLFYKGFRVATSSPKQNNIALVQSTSQHPGTSTQSRQGVTLPGSNQDFAWIDGLTNAQLTALCAWNGNKVPHQIPENMVPRQTHGFNHLLHPRTTALMWVKANQSKKMDEERITSVKDYFKVKSAGISATAVQGLEGLATVFETIAHELTKVTRLYNGLRAQYTSLTSTAPPDGLKNVIEVAEIRAQNAINHLNDINDILESAVVETQTLKRTLGCKKSAKSHLVKQLVQLMSAGEYVYEEFITKTPRGRYPFVQHPSTAIHQGVSHQSSTSAAVTGGQPGGVTSGTAIKWIAALSDAQEAALLVKSQNSTGQQIPAPSAPFASASRYTGAQTIAVPRPQTRQAYLNDATAAAAEQRTRRREESTSPSGGRPRKKATVNVDDPAPLFLPAWIGACLNTGKGKGTQSSPADAKSLANEAQKCYDRLDNARAYFLSQAQVHHDPMLKEKYADLKQACDSLRAQAKVIIQGIKDAGFDRLRPLTNLSEDQQNLCEPFRKSYVELRESCERLSVAISKVYKLCEVFGCPCKSRRLRANAEWPQAIPPFRLASRSKHADWAVQILRRQMNESHRKYEFTYA